MITLAAWRSSSRYYQRVHFRWNTNSVTHLVSSQTASYKDYMQLCFSHKDVYVGTSYLLWQGSLTHLSPLVMVASTQWCKGCWLGLEERVGVWLLGLRWGLCCCCCWDNLISTADGLPDTEGTDDADTEGTNFLSGEFNEYEHVT